MSLSFTIIDAVGTRVHTTPTDAVRVAYKSKIGTVVITDLRIADIPRDIPIVATMDADSIVLQATAINWQVYNAAAQNYTDNEQLFFLSLKTGELLVHVG